MAKYPPGYKPTWFDEMSNGGPRAGIAWSMSFLVVFAVVAAITLVVNPVYGLVLLILPAWALVWVFVELRRYRRRLRNEHHTENPA